MFGDDGVREVAANDMVEILITHFDAYVIVLAIILNLLQQVSWVTSSQRSTLAKVMPSQQVVYDLGLILALEFARVVFEKCVKLFRFRIADEDFVGDTPQKRLVYEFAGVQVRREDNQLLKGDLDFFPSR